MIKGLKTDEANIVLDFFVAAEVKILGHKHWLWF
jgi:hypothetical protein